MKTDIEIAQEVTLHPIADIAAALGIPAPALIPYGHYKAKVQYTEIDEAKVAPPTFAAPAL